MKTGTFCMVWFGIDGRHVVVRYLLRVGEAAVIQSVIRRECWDWVSKKKPTKKKTGAVLMSWNSGTGLTKREDMQAPQWR
jgi:hypothetical protein